MTTLKPQPGLRPAALPPTLQPHAVLALAPPTDRLRSAALSAAIYTLLAGGVVLLARAGVQMAQPKPIVDPHWVEIQPPVSNPAPAHPRMAAVPKTSAPPAVPKVEPPSQVIPDNPVSPSVDHSMDPPATPQGDPATADGPSDGGPISVSMDSLSILRQVDPVYPPVAKAARLQGTVVLRMTIDAQGTPASVEAVSGPLMLQGPAMKAAKQWLFQPATQNGEAVPATFLLTLNFVLR